MNFLVTGSSSYVGKYIINDLLKKKHFVIGISRTSPGIYHKNFFFKKHDLLKPRISLKKKIDVVIHAAGSAWMGLNSISYIESNVITSLNLYKFIKKIRPKAFFYISSRDIYGEIKSKILSEETDKINPIVYGQTKYLAEKIFKNLNNTIILRCPSILGIGTHGWINGIVQKLKNNKKIFFMNTKFNNFIHASELPLIILKILKKKIKNDHYLLGCSNIVFSKKIVLFLKKNLGSSSKISEIKNKGDFYTISVNKISKIHKTMTVEKTLNVYINELLKKENI
jgi:nucleoside-diphosphate-sugar epimerase